MFRLIIKGSTADSERALKERGFQPSDWLTQPCLAPLSHSQHVVTLVCVNDLCEPSVIRWFSENPVIPPFPAGSLLHYHKAQPTDSQKGNDEP